MNENLKIKLSIIKLLALDVDGVLTDGMIYYSERSGETKAFNVKDGEGLKQLLRADIKIAIISARNSPVVEKRAEELGIIEVEQGVKNKFETLKKLCDKMGINPNECAYMGDDLPDVEAMTLAGIRLTVSDAAPEIIDMADWISKKPGGKGAVREACETILLSINN